MAQREKDFEYGNPPKRVTDPQGAGAGKPVDPEYGGSGKHLARADEGGQREVRIVKNATEERDARKQGFMSHHELDAHLAKAKSAPKAKVAKKPAKKSAAKKTSKKQAPGPTSTSD